MRTTSGEQFRVSARTPAAAWAGALAGVVALAGVGVPASTASAAPPSPAVDLVRQVPASGTPHVLDGRVYSVARVGDTIVLGGRFTEARNDGSGTVLARRNLLAFDAGTGQLSSTFTPDPNGDVRVVIPVGDGETVYVGGSFRRIDGVAQPRLARVRVDDGSVVTSFTPNIGNKEVRDLRRTGPRLWVAGSFSTVAGKNKVGLVTLKANSGALHPHFSMAVTGTQNGGRTTVEKLDVNPKRNRLIALGNFRRIGGTVRRQLAVLNIAKKRAKLTAFASRFYGGRCGSAWNSYVRDLDFSPDGRFFVVSTTGGYRGAHSPCDSTARFETNAKGAVAPSWVDVTGGDTNYAVEVTDGAVYVGGHARWQNNPYRNNDAGPGAVRRDGIAALDPVNGLPFSWNPGRTRGVGVFDLLADGDGLWVASDTDRINHYLRSRIALLPTPLVRYYDEVSTPSLPGDLFATDTGSDGIARRSFDGWTVGAPSPVAEPAWGGGRTTDDIRGAFWLKGELYLAWADGGFDRRTFDGTSFGAPVPVDTHDAIVPLDSWADDVATMTGMFLDRGRIYYTLAGSDTLYYRYFTPESDVVGAERRVASGNVKGLDLSAVRGMFLGGNRLYWSVPKGKLRRIDWVTGTAAGRPVAGTARTVAGPAAGVDLSAPRSLFLIPDTP